MKQTEILHLVNKETSTHTIRCSGPDEEFYHQSALNYKMDYMHQHTWPAKPNKSARAKTANVHYYNVEKTAKNRTSILITGLNSAQEVIITAVDCRKGSLFVSTPLLAKMK